MAKYFLKVFGDICNKRNILTKVENFLKECEKKGYKNYDFLGKIYKIPRLTVGFIENGNSCSKKYPELKELSEKRLLVKTYLEFTLNNLHM